MSKLRVWHIPQVPMKAFVVKPREKVTMNRWQMHVSGLLEQVEGNGFWRDADWVFCRDGQWRPVESGTFPLVARFAKSMGHGKSSLRAMAGRNRTGRLKGYGNAINAQAAAAFISAYMELPHVPTNPPGTDLL